MAILQAYQVDVLKEMDEGTGLTPEAVKELRRATDFLAGVEPRLRTLPQLRFGEPVAGHSLANDHANGLTWSGPTGLPLRLLRVIPDLRAGMRRATSPSRGEARPQKCIFPPQTRSPHSDLSQPPLGVWCAERVHPHFTLVWQLGDPFVFPPLQFAASGPHVRGHSRFSPAAYGPRAGHLLVQHFTLHQPKQGRRGLSFVMESVTASRPSRHPNSGMSSFAQHSASSIAFQSRMGASTRGITLGSLHSSVRLHTSVWEKSPPLRRGSADSSKQRLQGFCSTTRTFLPPTEMSDRGNT